MATGIWIIAGVAIVLFLRAASELLIPVVLAVLISYAIEPAVAWMQRGHIPRVIGAGVLLASMLAIAGWGSYALLDDAAEAFETLPEVARRARALVWSQAGSGPYRTIHETVEELQGRQASPNTADDPPAASGVPQESGATSALTQWVQRGVGSILALAGHLTVIFFLIFFLVISGAHFRQRIVEIADQENRDIIATIVDDINARIQRFLLVHLVTAVVVAVATWAALAWMGVRQAAVWGILAGVFNSIPYFGPIIVTGGLFLVGLVQAGEVGQAVRISGAALAITALEGWLLTPPLLGRTEHMHVVVVFLGVLFWTWVWGAWGTLLAVPMLVIVKSIADHVDRLKPTSRLMSP
jgi:predicted PurR-regulated permease PerM